MIRGGGRGTVAKYCRSAARSYGFPNVHDDLGFRVALVPADK